MKKENNVTLHRLKRSIKEMVNDKITNEIKWVAEYNSKDDTEEKVIKLGIRNEGHLIFIYFDFDTVNSDGVADSEIKALGQIKERWGYLNTFKWLK